MMYGASSPPHRVFLAYLTGAGHLSAGIAIVCRVVPHLAAILEASMISLFVLLLHAPAVFSHPGDRFQWTMLFVAAALAGVAWAMGFKKNQLKASSTEALMPQVRLESQ